MTYEVALKVAAQAAEYLRTNDGNMTSLEMNVHAAALEVATKAISAHVFRVS